MAREAAATIIPPSPGPGADFLSTTYTHVARPGEVVTIQYQYRNSGTTSWIADGATQADLRACQQVAQSRSLFSIDCGVPSMNPTWNTGWPTASTYANQAVSVVAPGAIASYFWQVTVPIGTAPGSYQFIARLQMLGGAPLGPVLDQRILVPSGNVYTVNDVGDADVCDATTCTLRGAISHANDSVNSKGTDTIVFNILGPEMINPGSPLPDVIEGVIVDGTTQLGYVTFPPVWLNGTNAGAAANGLTLRAASSIRGLLITHFSRWGIEALSGGGGLITGNYVGVGPDGDSGAANGTANDAGTGGIRVLTPGYQIGTEALGDGNIVSANLGQGIEIGSNDAPTTTVMQNLVGLGRTGTNFPNGFNGILVLSPDALVQDNVAAYNLRSGIAIAADRGRYLDNVVRSNSGNGVLMSGNGNTFEKNTINSNAGAAVFMGFPGATTQGNQFNGNVVRDNTGGGFTLRGPATDPTEITDGNSILGGSISNNTGEGILLAFGANGGIVPPTITNITIDTGLVVSGQATPNALISVYADPQDEGREFLGTGTASDGDGTWTIGTWLRRDMATIEAALKVGALQLHATQTTSQGTSQFSPTVQAAPLVGVAACLRDIGDGVIVTTTLPGTTVTLLSGSTVIATTQSDAEFATYQFTGLAPFAPLIVQYAGTDADGVAHSCNVNVTTNGLGGGTVPEATPVINLGNHTWITAFPMTSGFAVSDVIDRPFRRTFYKLAVTPQQIVTVQLTNLTRNYQLLGYSDIRAAADKLLGSTGSLKTMRVLVGSGAVSAGDLDSGDLDSGDLDSGDLDSGDLDSGDLDSGDLDSGDLDSGDLDSGDLDSGDLDSGDLDSGDLDSGDLDSGDLDSGTVSVYQSAQRAALRYASGHAGTTPEGFTIHTRGYSGDLYFAVLGHDGVFDSSGIFQITATAVPESTACDLAPLVATPPSPVVFPTGKKTLILTNTLALGLTDPIAKAEFLGKLNTLATSTVGGFNAQGFVYDLDSNPAVKTMLASVEANPTCVPQANLATDTIKALIWGPGSFQAANSSTFEYVVFAGGDRAIPYRRITDLTFAGEINYSPPVGGVSGASLANNWYLTDSFYLAASPVERKGQLVWLNEVTGGRLVETATDILKNINTYTSQGGVLTPTSSLVAGYQFNTDLVDQLQTGLQLGGASPVRLPDDIWGAADLRNQLLVPNAPHYDVIAPQAHFTATRLVPADNGQRLLSTEVAGVTDTRFEGTVWLTIGCHSGYNIVDADATDLTIPVAFPEAILGRGGFLYGGTGYQFGDDEILANTELLLTNVMNEWRYSRDTSFALYPGGQVPLGKALANARTTYLNGLRSVRDIDRKVADVATFYGLPFYRVALSSGRLNRPHPAPIATTPIGAAGLSYSDVVASFSLNPNTGDGGGIFFDAGTQFDVASIATRPILPRTITNVSGVLGAAPTLPHGVVLRNATYTTVANRPVLSIPVSEDSVAQPATFLNSQFSPWMFDLNVLGGDQLVFTPAQYLSDANGLAGQLRKYSSIGTRVYYSTRTDGSALFGSPLVRGLTLTDVGGRVHVDATLFTLGTSTVQAAMFTYTGTVAPLSTLWKTVDLVGDAPVAVVGAGVTVGHLQHWHTVATGPAASLDIDPRNGDGSSSATVNDVFGVLQGVSDTGDVVVDTNQMRLYSIPIEPATAAAPKIPTALAFTTPPVSPTTYGTSVGVVAQLTSPGVSDMGGRRVIFRLGRTSVSAITGADGSINATVPVTVLPGSYQLQASFAEDDTALGSSTQAPLVVGMAVPAFEPSTGAATVQYSDNVGLAVLRTSTGQLLRWQPIILTRTDLPATDPARRVASFSDGTGTVRLDTMDFGGLGAGTYPIVATFPGDGLRFLPAMSGTFTVTVQREGATIVSTPPPQQTGLVTIQGTLVQDGPPADRAPGDITRAGIHYVGTDALGATFSGDAAVAADGTWSFTRTLAASVYSIALTVTGNFFSGSTNVIAVAYDPTTFGTGGGSVLATAGKVNFGFNVKYKDGTIPTGSMLLQLKEAKIDLKVTSFDWLVISVDGAGKKAEFQAHATINGSGSYTVHVIARDQPSGDTFSIVVTDAANHVVLSASGPVVGGSITVH